MMLISACLMGETCRYDGRHNLIPDLKEKVDKEALLCCPEVLGGLSTPRVPAEIVGGTAADVLDGQAQIRTKTGEDVTAAFLEGAYGVLELAKENQVSVAILKENSPSCGSFFVYDGTFSGIKVQGAGLTTTLLRRHGIAVYSEKNFKKVLP